MIKPVDLLLALMLLFITACTVHVEADIFLPALTPVAVVTPISPLSTPAISPLPTPTFTPMVTIGASYSSEVSCEHILKADVNSILERNFVYDPSDDRYPYVVMGPEDTWFCTEAEAAKFGFEPYAPTPRACCPTARGGYLTVGTVTPIPPEVEAQTICAIKGIAGAGYVGVFYVPGDTGYNDVEVVPERGDIWLCTLEQALMLGWEPASEHD